MAECIPPARINLIGWDNGRGLSQHIRLFQSALLELGHEVTVTKMGDRNRGLPWRAWKCSIMMHLRWLFSRGSTARQYDLNITLEHVHPAYLRLARHNAFVPHPEWLSRRDRRHLHRFEALLCMTAVARETFATQGLPTRLIGFQSVDCRQEDVPRERAFLHLAGASRMKGTERLLTVWRRHPEWPLLRLLQSPLIAHVDDGPTQENIDRRVEFVEDIEDFRRLQNAHAFHVCLSEAEGWGHYIVEAMSVGAVVLTTDGAPMNELVTNDRGILVAAHERGKQNAATLWDFDEAALECAVERVRTMSDGEIAAIGSAARAWYLTNQTRFPEQLRAALEGLV